MDGHIAQHILKINLAQFYYMSYTVLGAGDTINKLPLKEFLVEIYTCFFVILVMSNSL